MRDLYQEAQEEGKKLAKAQAVETAGYWTARHAARQTAAAILDEAARIELTPDQIEKLRAVAAYVAYD